jgi:hypothetical protein
MRNRSIFFSGFALCSIAGIVIAASTWQTTDPSQWTDQDVYQVLNNSPWSKAVKINMTKQPSYGGDSGSGANNGNTSNAGTMSRGMGRRGMGSMGGGGGRGSGGTSGGGTPRGDDPTIATVQWESALPVRIAEAKKNGGAADPTATKPRNEYAIAVIGLPKRGLGAKWSSSSGDDSDDTKLADYLKSITVLSVGHEHLNPLKVELNQGRDGRTVFHFETSEPITLADKEAEFRLTAERMELKKKFSLKDMKFESKLEL